MPISSQQPHAQVAVAPPLVTDTPEAVQLKQEHRARSAGERPPGLSWLMFRSAAKQRIRQRLSEMLRPSGTEDQLDVEFPNASRRWQVSVPAAVAFVAIALLCCGLFLLSQVLTTTPVLPNAGYLQSAMPSRDLQHAAVSAMPADPGRVRQAFTSAPSSASRASERVSNAAARAVPGGAASTDTKQAQRVDVPADQKSIQTTGDASRSIAVAVVGVVQNPGIYRFLAPDARILDAVERAGILGDSQLQGLNLAAKLQDGMQIVIPHRNDAQLAHTVGALETAPTARSQEGQESQDSAQLNINTASETELTSLPGVGAKTAAAIVAYRQEHGPFQNVTELQQVKGIGAAKYEALAPHIRI